MIYKNIIAGYPVYYSFMHEKTPGFFGDRIEECSEPNSTAVKVPDTVIRKYADESQCSYAYSEYMTSVYLASNSLLKFDCCAFHAVAIQVDGKGYLLSAVEGTGKTTQYLNLKKLYGDRINIINGDKPFLQFESDNKILIHSSPWRGKEDFGSELTCELAGIIFLTQADHNYIYRERPENTVVRSLNQFLYLPDKEETVRKVCELDRRLISNVPIWMLKNLGDLSSSELLYRTVLTGGDVI